MNTNKIWISNFSTEVLN